MNIEKALEHFEWRLKNHWKPTKKDVEAFNSIIEFKQMHEGLTLTNNEHFAKLWIHQLMLLNETKMYTGERSVQVIDEILDRSVHDWCLRLHDNICVMNYRTIMETGTDEQQLEKLKKEITEENIVKFVESNITRLIQKF